MLPVPLRPAGSPRVAVKFTWATIHEVRRAKLSATMILFGDDPPSDDSLPN